MKAMFLCAATLLIASPTFAAGIDLTSIACPNNAGAMGGDAGSVDCANGSVVVVFGTFQPSEAISDLVGLEGIIDLQGPDLDASSFWNVTSTGCGSNGVLGFSHVRPAVGCTGYVSTWGPTGSSEAVEATLTGSVQRIAFTCYRPTILSVAANQKLFAFEFTSDASQAVEAGGPCTGCPQSVCLVWKSGRPHRVCGLTPSELTTGTGVPGVSNALSFNGGSGLCAGLSVRTPTIDRIRSLCR